MKRKLLWLAAVEALGVAFVALYLTNQPPGVNQLTYDRIKLGMTEAEVDGVLGRPPGKYTTWPVRVDDDYSIEGNWPNPGELDDSGIVNGIRRLNDKATGQLNTMVKFWSGDFDFLQVAFDNTGVVKGRCFLPCTPARRSWLERFFGWLWR